jgi:Ca2+-binding EF-hand superfamily protein
MLYQFRHFLSSVAEAIMDRRFQSVRVQLASRELSAEDLEIMDTDGDGKVSRAEFLEFMLVAMNIVDKEFIDELRQHFGRLDVDGTGILSKEDLVHVARGKLQRIQRKLQLASYKQELLAKATSGRRLHQHTSLRGQNKSSSPPTLVGERLTPATEEGSHSATAPNMGWLRLNKSSERHQVSHKVVALKERMYP